MQIKPEFLQIIEENFLISVEILPMLVGLVTSILPGLEEKDEAIQKKIFEILSRLQQCTGEKFLIGAIWIAILRTPKVRAMAIQFLTRHAKKKASSTTTSATVSTAAYTAPVTAEFTIATTPGMVTEHGTPTEPSNVSALLAKGDMSTGAQGNGLTSWQVLSQNITGAQASTQTSQMSSRLEKSMITVSRPDCRFGF